MDCKTFSVLIILNRAKCLQARYVSRVKLNLMLIMQPIYKQPVLRFLLYNVTLKKKKSDCKFIQIGEMVEYRKTRNKRRTIHDTGSVLVGVLHMIKRDYDFILKGWIAPN